MKNRIIVLDYLRIALAILVVAVHADAITLSPTNYLGGISWWIAALFNSLGRVAVPLFVVTSGALLLSKELQTRSNVQIFKRLGIPFLIWIVFYYLFNTFYLHQTFSFGIGHLYYLAIAIGLSIVSKYLKRHEHLLSLNTALFLLLFSLLYDFLQFTKIIDFPILYSNFLLWVMYLGYFILGHVMQTRIKLIYLLPTAIITASVGAISLYLGKLHAISDGDTFWFSDGNNYFFSHFSPAIVLLTLTTWGVINELRLKVLVVDGKLKSMIIALAESTYGIYLVHPFILHVMENDLGFAIHQVSYNLALYYIFKTIIAFALSFSVTQFLLRNRYLSVLVGR